MNRTAAQRLPKRDSKGSMRVVNPSRRMRPEKKMPPRIRLMPKHRPPWTPEEMPVAYAPSAVPRR